MQYAGGWERWKDLLLHLSLITVLLARPPPPTTIAESGRRVIDASPIAPDSGTSTPGWPSRSTYQGADLRALPC